MWESKTLTTCIKVKDEFVRVTFKFHDPIELTGFPGVEVGVWDGNIKEFVLSTQLASSTAPTYKGEANERPNRSDS